MCYSESHHADPCRLCSVQTGLSLTEPRASPIPIQRSELIGGCWIANFVHLAVLFTPRAPSAAPQKRFAEPRPKLHLYFLTQIKLMFRFTIGVYTFLSFSKKVKWKVLKLLSWEKRICQIYSEQQQGVVFCRRAAVWLKHNALRGTSQ